MLIQKGDLILILQGNAHILADSPDLLPLDVHDVVRQTGFTGSGTLVYGEARGEFVTMVCGHLEFDDGFMHPLLAGRASPPRPHQHSRLFPAVVAHAASTPGARPLPRFCTGRAGDADLVVGFGATHEASGAHARQGAFRQGVGREEAGYFIGRALCLDRSSGYGPGAGLQTIRRLAQDGSDRERGKRGFSGGKARIQ